MSPTEIQTEYNDNDFVYVDVQAKKIIGVVEWNKDGNAVKKEKIFVEPPEPKEGETGKIRRRKSTMYYPWCSYATAKKVYNIEGKFNEKEDYEPFEIVLQKALEKPYWNKGQSDSATETLTESEQPSAESQQ